MWSTDTLWFDVAVVMSIFAVGNILFGHFEARRPTWKRLLKMAFFLLLIVGLSATVGRVWAYGALLTPAIVVLYIHTWWLPKHDVHGWTGEPKERCYALIGHTAEEEKDEPF